GRMQNSLPLQHAHASDCVQSYHYDRIRRLPNVVSPAGSIGYEVTSVGQSGSPASLIKKLGLPGGSYITHTFDSVARLLSTSLKNSTNAVLNSHAYVSDLDGQLTKQTFKAGNYLNYTYDALGQLQTPHGHEPG